jgi:chemotaxis signal transduction protein
VKAVVCFSTEQGRFAVPVEQTRQVVPADGIAALPDPLPGVVGLMRAEPDPMPVVAVLGESGGHVLVLHDGERRFGLLVDEVMGLERVEAAAIRPAPAGQRRELVTGVIDTGAGPRLLVDASILGRAVRA